MTPQSPAQAPQSPAQNDQSMTSLTSTPRSSMLANTPRQNTSSLTENPKCREALPDNQNCTKSSYIEHSSGCEQPQQALQSLVQTFHMKRYQFHAEPNYDLAQDICYRLMAIPKASFHVMNCRSNCMMICSRISIYWSLKDVCDTYSGVR